MNKTKILTFEKVSKGQFIYDYMNIYNPSLESDAIRAYEMIQLPQRATSGSVGYDFFAPTDIFVPMHKSLVIPTGIRFLSSNPNIALFIYPKSGLGFNYFCGMANTVGIIDSDYAGAENQGHILVKITANGNKDIKIEQGKSFVQGILTECLFSTDDNLINADIIERHGGFGSTSI